MSQSVEIVLKPWAESDLSLLERLLGDPVMTEHLGGPESAEQIIKRNARYVALADSDDCMFVIMLTQTRQAVGSVGYWAKDWKREKVWETGWSILPEFQGQGFATQGVKACLTIARDAGKYRSVHAFPSVHNVASNALCQKTGFVLQGVTEFEYPPGRMMSCNDWLYRLDINNEAN